MELKTHNTPEDIKSVFIKINLIKTKWVFLAAIAHLASLTNTFFKILEKSEINILISNIIISR